ncbi:hypothetical protein D9M68_999930 [compost metagenome]
MSRLAELDGRKVGQHGDDLALVLPEVGHLQGEDSAIRAGLHLFAHVGSAGTGRDHADSFNITAVREDDAASREVLVFVAGALAGALLFFDLEN